MKKACIALTVIFLLSSLLTVCFGAAVGAREIRSILDGDSSWNHLLESIKSWHEHGTGQFLGETHMQFPVDSSKPVCLFFDFAKVSVLSTPDQSASMYVRYYGKNSVDDLSSLPYAEQEDGALHLGLHLPDQNSFTEITVEIYLPMAKYTALNAEVGVGSLTVENMQFGALVSSVKVGNTCLKRTSADSVKLVAATGNLAWEDGSRVLKSLSMHTEVGNIQLAWATGDGFRLAYQIGSGKLKNQFEGAVTEQTGSKHASSKGTLTSGDESRAIELSASTGDISLTSFSTKE